MPLVLLGLPGLALAHDPPEEPGPERLFMPALELGVLWHTDPAIRAGPVFRTSVDFRLARVRAPFLRVSYDATTARITRADDAGVERLTANLALHDVVAGGGIRLGPDAWQLIGDLQLGIQVAELPVVRREPNDTLSVDTETRVAGLAMAGVGLEIYFDPEAAFTVELAGRSRLSRLDEDLSPLAVGLTIGVTTAL